MVKMPQSEHADASQSHHLYPAIGIFFFHTPRTIIPQMLQRMASRCFHPGYRRMVIVAIFWENYNLGTSDLVDEMLILFYLNFCFEHSKSFFPR